MTDIGCMQDLPSISVVLCCHNSANRLPETLEHIALLKIPPGLQWEILVIDNASSDHTPRVVHEFLIEYPHLAVRVVHEPQLGQAYARLRGVSEAVHDTILFVDDDNWLEADYLGILAETLREHPEIAALGGTSSAFCEGLEPPWFSTYQGWYAVTGAPADRNSLTELNFLWTAGAAFRRRALDRAEALGVPLLISGRRGETLEGGEDHEMCYLVRLSGGRLFRHSGMHFRHYLPASRLKWDYLCRLLYASGRVSVKLDAYRFNESASFWPRWILRSTWLQISNVLFQSIRYRFNLWRTGRWGIEGDEMVVRWEIYRGRLAALWSCRRDYRSMVRRHTGIITALRRNGSAL
jgi:glycosyltransferase involved in cell wall biosynthesis